MTSDVLTPRDSFAAHMKRARLALGLSQAGFVKELRSAGLSKADQAMVSKIERGERRIDVNEALQISAAIGLPLTQMLGLSEGPTPEQLTGILAESMRTAAARVIEAYA